MLDNIIRTFNILDPLVQVLGVVERLIKRSTGNRRALLEEVKQNLYLCWMVVAYQTSAQKIIPALKTEEYDRLLKEGFNFNQLSRQKRIRGNPELANSDLAPFVGKETKVLVENIYDRIKSLKLHYEIDPENPHIRWRRRVINLLKRILLLIEHLQYYHLSQVSFVDVARVDTLEELGVGLSVSGSRRLQKMQVTSRRVLSDGPHFHAVHLPPRLSALHRKR
ncbi:MAG: hypothetical protein D6706_02965 [Chloroflexi bacterium]|nr:MAG: hypothetical protein D6706_02965 [Chloroflexota bacterium]